MLSIAPNKHSEYSRTVANNLFFNFFGKISRFYYWFLLHRRMETYCGGKCQKIYHFEVMIIYLDHNCLDNQGLEKLKCISMLMHSTEKSPENWSE